MVDQVQEVTEVYRASRVQEETPELPVKTENKVNKVSVVPTDLPVMLDRKVHAEIPVKMEIVAEWEIPESSEKSGSMEKMATKGLTALEVCLDRRGLKHLAAVKDLKEIAVSLASPAVPVMTVNRVDLVLKDVPVMSENPGLMVHLEKSTKTNSIFWF